MTPKFESLAGVAWRAQVDGVSIFIDDESGRPEPAQLAIASRVAADLAAVRSQGARYLDVFVDRQKTSGKPGEEWWLDEIELRGMAADNPRVGLHFTLDGDVGGHWIVEMRWRPDGFHPIRLERRQG